MVEMCLLWGIGFPFLGTVLGAGLVWLFREDSRYLGRILSGAAAGVMGWAAVASLFLPAMEMSEAALPGAVLGILFLTVTGAVSGKKSWAGGLIALAMVLHNIPEGMAAGAGFGSWLSGGGISMGQALSVGVGIGLQNVPDGAMVSLPLYRQGMGRGRAFALGAASGLVEPVAAGMMLLMAGRQTALLPALMGFAAGAMAFVIAFELIPGMELHRGRWEGLAALIPGLLLARGLL